MFKLFFRDSYSNFWWIYKAHLYQKLLLHRVFFQKLVKITFPFLMCSLRCDSQNIAWENFKPIKRNYFLNEFISVDISGSRSTWPWFITAFQPVGLSKSFFYQFNAQHLIVNHKTCSNSCFRFLKIVNRCQTKYHAIPINHAQKHDRQNTWPM